MKIFVVRHGKTIWNEKHITQGWSQNRLSELGKAQAQKAAEKLKETKLDLIFSSPLMRTIQTTNILNQFHKVKVIRDKRLIEDNKGIFTGKTDKQITKEQWQLFEKDPKACGIESWDEIFARVKEFTIFLKENYSDKKVLVVTHDRIALMIEYCSIYDNFDESKFKSLTRFKNAECRQIDLGK